MPAKRSARVRAFAELFEFESVSSVGASAFAGSAGFAAPLACALRAPACDDGVVAATLRGEGSATDRPSSWARAAAIGGIRPTGVNVVNVSRFASLFPATTTELKWLA